MSWRRSAPKYILLSTRRILIKIVTQDIPVRCYWLLISVLFSIITVVTGLFSVGKTAFSPVAGGYFSLLISP
jgi:hypothetical protein